jgi:hypothetical protein
MEWYVNSSNTLKFGNPGEEAGIITAPVPDRIFNIAKLEIAQLNESAQRLWTDFGILKGIAREESLGQLAADALYTANLIVNTVRVDKLETVDAALAITDAWFAERRDMGRAGHEISATGHCHIGESLSF